MTAFNDAFYILKNEYMFDVAHDNLLRKGKAEEAIELRQMRQFVLNNENSPDPAMRQAAEDMYQKLTQIMSAQSRTPPMQPPQGPVGEGAAMGDMSQPAQPPQHPMMKAWDFFKSNYWCRFISDMLLFKDDLALVNAEWELRLCAVGFSRRHS